MTDEIRKQIDGLPKYEPMFCSMHGEYFLKADVVSLVEKLSTKIESLESLVDSLIEENCNY